MKKLAVLIVLLCGVATAAPNAQYGRHRREPRSYSNPDTDAELRQVFHETSICRCS